MPPTRSYIQKSAKELEALFEASKTDLATVKRILAELKHRKTPSAHALRDKVEKHLKATTKQPNDENSTEPPKTAPEPESPSNHIVECKGCRTKIRIPVREESIVYRCPKCQISFEAEYRAGVMEIVFLKDEPQPKKGDEVTIETARIILGVTAAASFADIKVAWRRLSQQYHPDKHQGLPERLKLAAAIEMQRINLAYQLLARESAEEF